MKVKSLGIYLLVCLIGLPGISFAKASKEAVKKTEEFNKKIKSLADAGDLQKSIETAEEALAFSVKEFGDKSLETAHALNNVANLYMFSGNPANAERLYKESILILTNKKDKEGLEAADYYYNLGMAYAMQKKYDEASKILNQCLQIRAKELGNKNAETQKVQKVLADVWEEQKKL